MINFLFLFYLKDESNEIKLDFIYDDDLATSFPDKAEQKTSTVEEGSPVTVSLSGGSGGDHNAGPTSPAAQDLNSKIAAVKTFWDSDQTTVFDVYVYFCFCWDL